MKRFIYILICTLLLTTLLTPSVSIASAEDPFGSITTPHMALMEAETGTLLYGRSENEKAYPASTTKIMTCIIALENCGDISTIYTCGSEATDGFGAQSSLLGLKSGYKISVRDMLYGLMLVSGNDCGACLAVATAGSKDAFVELMNDKATELGMRGTHFTNPHGLQSDDHYTTAYDMALLMKYALQNADFRAILATKEYNISTVGGQINKTIYTSNKLLYTKNTDTENNEYSYCIGGKTGETNTAGFCLVTAAKKDGVTLIAVQFGDNNQGGTTTYYRFRNAVKLFDWGFENFVSYTLTGLGVATEFNIQTTGYSANDPNSGMITAVTDVSGVLLSGSATELGQVEAASITIGSPELDSEAIAAPVAIGDTLGTVSYYYQGKLICTVDLVAASAVSAQPNDTEEPTVTTFVSSTPKPGTPDNCNLTISKNGGEAEYTVWVYYQNTLYTMENGTTWHYLYCDGDTFRASTVPDSSAKVVLYKQVTDESGNVSYTVANEVESGSVYVVTSDGMALQAHKKSRSLMAIRLEFDENGAITTEIQSNMLWKFTSNGSGYQLTSNGYYLHRSAGDGLLFWILIIILVIVIAIVIRLLVTRKNRRRSPKRRGKYKIYRVG